MKKPTTLVFRFAGIIFFVGAMMSLLNVLDTCQATLGFILSDENGEYGVFWNAFFLVTATLYAASFALFLFATGTAALFGGKRGFTQSVFNSALYSLVTLSLYASINILTGVNEEEKEILYLLVQSIVMELSFCVIAFFCLRDSSEEDEAAGGVDTSAFAFKKIFILDENMRLSFKALLVFLALIWFAAFLMVHI